MEFVDQCWINEQNLDPPQTPRVKPAKKPTDIPPILALPAQNSSFQTKTTEMRNPQPTAKRSNPVPPTVLTPEKSNRKPSTLKKETLGSLRTVKIEKKDPDIATDETAPFFFVKKEPDIDTDGTPPFDFPMTPTKKMRGSLSTAKCEKKDPNFVTDEKTAQFDFSSIPTPICSCTGVPRQCYRWGAGGWQSSCCTTNISKYPLPMSPSRPPARMAGRKMSIGAYVKLLQRLADGGHDLSKAVDLKNYWARHGTNKFVTIR